MDKREMIIKMFLAGDSYKAIMAATGRGHNTIRLIVRAAGIPRRPKPKTHVDIQDEVVDLYQQGLPLSVIADKFGIKDYTVVKIATRAGIAMRKAQPGETIKDRVIAARSSGASRKEVAEALNLTRRQVSAVCRRVGL